MKNYDNELYFLANIYMKPDLIKQIVIPIECIENGLNRFVLQAFMFTYKKSGTIDVPSLLQENQRGFEGRYSQQDFMGVITRLIELGDEFTIREFDYYQELLLEAHKETLYKEAIKKYETKKINQEEFINLIHNIENKSIQTNTGYKTIEEINELVLTNNKTIPFRLEKLSNRVKLQEHDLMVISARTGVGKSGFALNLLEDLSKTHKCILFNMEMSESSVYKRLISIMTSVPMDMLATPQTDYQKKVIQEAIEELSKRKLKIISIVSTSRRDATHCVRP